MTAVEVRRSRERAREKMKTAMEAEEADDEGGRAVEKRRERMKMEVARHERIRAPRKSEPESDDRRKASREAGSRSARGVEEKASDDSERSQRIEMTGERVVRVEGAACEKKGQWRGSDGAEASEQCE